MKNKSTRRCPFEIVYTKRPRLTSHLGNLPSNVDINNEAENMIERIQNLHKEVHEDLHQLLHLINKIKTRKEEK